MKRGIGAGGREAGSWRNEVREQEGRSLAEERWLENGGRKVRVKGARRELEVSRERWNWTLEGGMCKE